MFKFKNASAVKLPFNKEFIVALNEDWDIVLYKNKLLSPQLLQELLSLDKKEEIEQELLYISLDKLFVTIPSFVTNVEEFWDYLQQASL